MIIIGVVLLIAGFLLAIPILWTIGIICLVIGLILMALSFGGGGGGGWYRRRYY